MEIILLEESWFTWFYVDGDLYAFSETGDFFLNYFNRRESFDNTNSKFIRL